MERCWELPAVNIHVVENTEHVKITDLSAVPGEYFPEKIFEHFEVMLARESDGKNYRVSMDTIRSYVENRYISE